MGTELLYNICFLTGAISLSLCFFVVCWILWYFKGAFWYAFRHTVFSAIFAWKYDREIHTRWQSLKALINTFTNCFEFWFHGYRKIETRHWEWVGWFTIRRVEPNPEIIWKGENTEKENENGQDA